MLATAVKKGNAAPNKESIFEKTYPGQPYDDQQMRLSTSYLYKKFRAISFVERGAGKPVRHQSLLLAAYRKRRLPAHFQKALNRSQKQLSRQPLRHPELFLEKYFIEHERYLFLSETGRTKELNLQEVEDQLTAAMLAMKLRQACFLRSHETVFNTNYHLALEAEVLTAAEQPFFQNNPAVSLYRTCYVALFKRQSEEDFQLFKSNLFGHVGQFPEEEMRDLYLLAINYCIKKVNEGDSHFYREALDLYKSGLETGLLLKDNRLSRFTYNNIVAVAMRLEEEWDWAGQFVVRYKTLLEPAYQEAAFSLNSARLAFVKKDYDSALLHLQKADYKDLINNMVAKVLQMKIYFEMEEYELLDSHLRTMRMFIRRNKKMAYHRENWSNIVRYTQKLMELSPFDTQRKQLLLQQIEKEETLTEKEWLVGQLG